MMPTDLGTNVGTNQRYPIQLQTNAAVNYKIIARHECVSIKAARHNMSVQPQKYAR
jgi:hypothetical protein